MPRKRQAARTFRRENEMTSDEAMGFMMFAEPGDSTPEEIERFRAYMTHIGDTKGFDRWIHPTPAFVLSDAEALALMQDPARYAGQSLPAGLWAWAQAQPGGAEVWAEWIRKVWAATDGRRAAL